MRTATGREWPRSEHEPRSSAGPVDLAIVKLLQRSPYALGLFERGILSVHAPSSFGITAIYAVSYALWPEGVSRLLALGANPFSVRGKLAGGGVAAVDTAGYDLLQAQEEVDYPEQLSAAVQTLSLLHEAGASADLSPIPVQSPLWQVRLVERRARVVGSVDVAAALRRVIAFRGAYVALV